MSHDEHDLLKVAPDDLGLEPLHCGECGEKEIAEHPCPRCGFNPEEKG